ncbi:GH1 family beta-glucosidase [Labedaea rhizosphaerae]|uniref:Beta-glucosidase n=1 Tax=Labedaea rhizosphaerae TaxID=598644 RepID=A0A4R6SLM3_LABRH|nr:GH1 family beta-glucosidase [Labedaea rhizosphaerae]TDQ05128.1 beta-glucosidase [Labedaea rhizosphaerae]
MAGPQFPADFLWGVSASAFQIEGAVAEGGRGRSSWDTFCATPGKIAGDETADVACDHYHRYAEDVALMAGLGVDAYRLSFAWPRIQPDGSGKPNPEGIAFYDRLLDALCAAGITPVGTLYHWDTPQPLEDAGGWRNRETALRFGEYARIAAERFADRVPMWIPINEPMVTSIYGYAIGQYAPGEFLLLDALPTAHHQNLAHGLAVQALRAAGADQVGTANNHGPVWPVGPDDGDAASAMDELINRLFADPVLLGRYPDRYTEHLPAGFADDLPAIATPIDFYGVNYYEPQAAASPSPGNPLPFDLVPVEGYPMTTNDSPIVPGALTELLVGMRDRYGDALPPIHITENGCSFDDEVGPDGRVRDGARIEFLEAHLRALADAMAAGVDVRGYFVWSILDNFEWSKGYAPRFGLVHVDFKTLQRTPKDSYRWYRDLIASAR